MTLTEKQWLQMEYDRLNVSLQNLDIEQTISTKVYYARHKQLGEMFGVVAKRLNEVEKEEELK